MNEDRSRIIVAAAVMAIGVAVTGAAAAAAGPAVSSVAAGYGRRRHLVQCQRRRRAHLRRPDRRHPVVLG
jgi:hypothetical protein